MLPSVLPFVLCAGFGILLACIVGRWLGNVLPVALVLGILLCPVSSEAAGKYAHGHKVYHSSGYYQWDGYACTWKWYAYPKQAYGTYTNNSQTFNQTIHHYQPAAQRGQTQYGTIEASYQYGAPLDPNVTLNFGKELLGVAFRGAYDGFSQAMQFASQQSGNDVEVAKEFAQVQKLDRLAAVAQSTQPQASSKYYRQDGYQPQVQPYHNGYQQQGQQQFGLGQQIAGNAILLAVEGKCMTCHAEGVADQQAKGKRLRPFDQFTPVDAAPALQYVSRLDEANCAVKAQLNEREQAELVRFLCSRSQGGN